MLAVSFSEMHLAGGIEYMSPLTFLFVLNMGILVFLFIRFSKERTFGERWLEAFKQIGALILVYGVFGTLTGFFQMFDALEATKEDLPRQVISGGVKVAFLPITYGFALFSINQTLYIILNLLNKKTEQV